jgi:transcriptional regulator with XRE-family HTH domain
MGQSDDDREERWKRDFGYRLRRLRDGKGLSQGTLADLAGLHPTYVSGVERGQRNLSLVSIHRLADALGVPVTDLFRSW